MNAPALCSTRTRGGGEFLLIDAATAHTLLDVAETTRDVVNARRDIQLARESLETLNRYLDELDLETALRAVIERSRDKLRARLSVMEGRFVGSKSRSVGCATPEPT